VGGGKGLGDEEDEKGGGGHAQKQLYEELWTTLKVEEEDWENNGKKIKENEKGMMRRTLRLKRKRKTLHVLYTRVITI
jgi:hypothetical protein